MLFPNDFQTALEYGMWSICKLKKSINICGQEFIKKCFCDMLCHCWLTLNSIFVLILKKCVLQLLTTGWLNYCSKPRKQN